MHTNLHESTAELTRDITEYQPCCEEERKHQQYITRFVEQHEHPFDRAHLNAHLTGSALVINHAGTHVLLGFHRKLGRWLQMGGHGEPGETSARAVAMREAQEESGIAGLTFVPSVPAPVDLDVHTIPARGGVPEHLHLDIRYLVQAPANADHTVQIEEQEELRWFTWDETLALDLDVSLRRFVEKAKRYCAR
jgi:8-oxo-dGTP pyrophosphatase MutT (NUDIX family)